MENKSAFKLFLSLYELSQLILGHLQKSIILFKSKYKISFIRIFNFVKLRFF